jgi:Flagellar hook-length control protein FliK
MPKIASGEAPVMPSSSKASPAAHGATQSFSDLLERANSSPSEVSGTKQNSGPGLAQEDHSPVGSPYKRDAKSSDSKVSDSQGHGGTASRAPLDSPSDKAATVMAAQPTLPPALSWNTGSALFTPSPLAVGAVPKDEGIPASDSEADTPLDSAALAIHPTLSPTLPPALSWNTGSALLTPSPLAAGAVPHEEAIPASDSEAGTPLGSAPLALPPPLSPSLSWNAGINGSAYATVINGAAPNDEATSSAALGAESYVNPDSNGGSSLLPRFSEEVVLAEPQLGTAIQDAAIRGNANTSDPKAVASLSTNRSGALVSDSTTQFGDRSRPSISLRNPSHGPVEIGDEVHKAKAAAASAPEQVGASPSTAPLTLIPQVPTPDPGKIDLGATKGTRDKPATDKSRVSGTQDSLGTTEKTSEVAGSEKAQPGKDWTPSFAGTSTTGQNTNTAPASAVDLLPSFSISGTQSPPITTDGKSASEAVPSGASDQQPLKLEQSSTGFAEAQASGERAAAYPTSLVQSAKLVERIGEAELRLGIRAGEFGSVDIRTSMVHNQFTAEISVERGELGRVMAAELPGLQSRLTEQGVPVASVTVQNHAGGPSTGSDQQNPRGGQQPYATNLARAREEGPIPMLVASEGTAPASRLDIHM